MGLLIFVFERVSCGRRSAILAEFAAVPTDQLPVLPEPRPASSTDVRPTTGHPSPTREVGGPKGLEPTRYGDWERNGRCVDF
jgi:hypothetical protein